MNMSLRTVEQEIKSSEMTTKNEPGSRSETLHLSIEVGRFYFAFDLQTAVYTTETKFLEYLIVSSSL